MLFPSLNSRQSKQGAHQSVEEQKGLILLGFPRHAPREMFASQNTAFSMLHHQDIPRFAQPMVRVSVPRSAANSRCECGTRG
jgi:hypothetical protein